MMASVVVDWADKAVAMAETLVLEAAIMEVHSVD